jgi:hypothetical protein
MSELNALLLLVLLGLVIRASVLDPRTPVSGAVVPRGGAVVPAGANVSRTYLTPLCPVPRLE